MIVAEPGPSPRKAVRSRKPGTAPPFARRVETFEERLIAAQAGKTPEPQREGLPPQAKIVPTRWKNGEGRWLYVAEITAQRDGRQNVLAGVQPDGEPPPLYAIFADNPAWHSNAPIGEKMQRMLLDYFYFPWTSFVNAQVQLNAYAQQKGWTPCPPLPVDDEEAKPVRRKAGKVNESSGPLCNKCGWPATNNHKANSEEDSAMPTTAKHRPDRRAAPRGEAKHARSPLPTPAPSTALVPAPQPVGPLSKKEERDLEKLEGVIRNGARAFMAVGTALTEIQSRRLYRGQFGSFEDYCRQVWSFGRAEAFDKISAARIAAVVSPISDKAKIPLREDHLKALAPLAEEQDIREVYQRVLKRCQKEHEPITGKALREERQRYLTPGDELEKDAGGREPRTRGHGDGETRGPALVSRGPLGVPSAEENATFSRALNDVESVVMSLMRTWRYPEFRANIREMLYQLARKMEDDA
jgi:hypothetical protein